MEGSPGAIKAKIILRGGVAHNIDIAPTGRVSDSVTALKARVGDVLSKYLATNNMDEGEVDIMEEVVSDEDGEGDTKEARKKKGVKRKKGIDT